MPSMKHLGTSKVTGKSSITVPKPVRETLNISKGDLVVFVMLNGQIVVKRGSVKIDG